jgi:hypothetical protein
LAKAAVAELKKLLAVAPKAGLAQDVDVFFRDGIHTQLYLSQSGDGFFTRFVNGQLVFITPLPLEDYTSFVLQHQICPDDIVKIRRKIEAEIKKG